MHRSSGASIPHALFLPLQEELQHTPVLRREINGLVVLLLINLLLRACQREATSAPGPSDDSERVAETAEPEGSTDSADRGATPDTDEGPPRDTRTRRRRGGTDGDGAPACIGKESSAGGVAVPPMDSATSTEPFCAGDVFALGVDPSALLCGGATVPSGTERSITGGEPGVGPAEA